MISVPNDPHDRAKYTSDSRDCVDLSYDGPGDSTRRPLTGEALKRAMAMRELIERWGTMTNDADDVIDITISDD